MINSEPEFKTRFYAMTNLTEDGHFGYMVARPWLDVWNGWRVSPTFTMEVVNQRKVLPPSEHSGIEIQSPELVPGMKLEAGV